MSFSDMFSTEPVWCVVLLSVCGVKQVVLMYTGVAYVFTAHTRLCLAQLAPPFDLMQHEE